MNIFVNGESRELTEGHTVGELLADLGFEQDYVAVALNNVCIRRADFASTGIEAGDQLEILAPMAGG
jgi:thiamine biosynthesis protein ThiS